MSFRVVRQTKFRHVFGKEQKRSECYDGIKISKNANESPFCDVNSKFYTIVLEAQGGGAFLVAPLSQTGRVDLNAPKVTGHTRIVLDAKFCPYNDNLIASSSDDCSVKIWEIPDGGLTANLNEPLVSLEKHQKRVNTVEWHPLAENIILSCAPDVIYVWDILNGSEPLVEIPHDDFITCVCWSLSGNLIATTAKDKKLRVFEAHTGKLISEGPCHNGSKSSRCAFVGENDMLMTTGFSKNSERQYAIWNYKDLSKALKLENIDNGSGVQFIKYDPDTRMVYLAGKGDGNIRYYEVEDEAPYCHYLSEFKSSHPQRGICFFPKTACNAMACEVAKVLKLHPRGFAEVISFTVPRKATVFQEDLFPDTNEPVATGTADDFKAGKKLAPKKVSMKSAYTAVTKAAPIKSTSSAPSGAASSSGADDGIPQGPQLVAAYKSQQAEIKDLRKQIATLEIKLRAAMKALDK